MLASRRFASASWQDPRRESRPPQSGRRRANRAPSHPSFQTIHRASWPTLSLDFSPGSGRVPSGLRVELRLAGSAAEHGGLPCMRACVLRFTVDGHATNRVLRHFERLLRVCNRWPPAPTDNGPVGGGGSYRGPPPSCGFFTFPLPRFQERRPSSSSGTSSRPPCPASSPCDASCAPSSRAAFPSSSSDRPSARQRAD